MMTKNKIFDFIIFLLYSSLLLIAGYLIHSTTNNCQDPFNEKEHYDQIIKTQQIQIDSLWCDLELQQMKVDSLQLLKQQTDTIWKYKVLQLKEVNISGLYLLLQQQIEALCGEVNAGKLYINDKDTFALYERNSLQCINQAFIDREYMEVELAFSEEAIAELENMNMTLSEIINRKDIIINAKDSIIALSEVANAKIKKQNKHLKLGIAASLTGLILSIIAN